ncbi:unnamed protein product [Orchesella dallaii]|uniref:Integrase catalytic domain-containing protein n=1 Tax=Orchesella dallaii TaxID=48710 RepID=A0ABP1QZC7_9HEXA
MLTMIANQHSANKQEELNRTDAEKALFKLLQQSTFSGIKDEKFKNLQVFEDEDCIIRLKTRLSYGEFEEKFKYPIVLPSKSPIVTALILEEHENNSHAGTQTLQSLLREDYWILKSRKTIRNAIRRCNNCQVYMATKVDCEAAPLPKERVQADIPFQVTGVDMFGPLFLKDGSKSWVALFTCAVYRAVHLELVTSLSTDAFKNAFRRFVSRRGRPSIVYSDNGTNFVGMNNQFKSINWKKIEKFGAFQKIKWRFNPPTAAWWGGFWERMVGVVKQTLRKVLGRASLEYEDLQTVLCDVEGIVNRRPLTYVSEDPNDLTPLSPYLFLTGNKSSDVPEADAIDGKSLNKRWRRMQRVREDLRSRFRKEYLGQLRSNAFQKKNYELKIGDKVMIGHDNQKRLNWPIGRIEELIKGKDGQIRVVKVKTEDGMLLRPIQRIYPLETYEDDAPEEKPVETGSESANITRYGRKVKFPTRLTYMYLD